MLPKWGSADAPYQCHRCPSEARPGQYEVIAFDDALTGFGVRMRVGGKGVWFTQYRFEQDGKPKQRRVKLGKVGTVSAEQAREAAKKHLAYVQLGPTLKLSARPSVSAAQLRLRLHRQNFLERTEARMRPRSFAEVKRHLENIGHRCCLVQYTKSTAPQSRCALTIFTTRAARRRQ